MDTISRALGMHQQLDAMRYYDHTSLNSLKDDVGRSQNLARMMSNAMQQVRDDQERARAMQNHLAKLKPEEPKEFQRYEPEWAWEIK